MKNLEGLSRDEILKLIEEKTKNIEAIVTKNEDGIAIISRDYDYTQLIM